MTKERMKQFLGKRSGKITLAIIILMLISLIYNAGGAGAEIDLEDGKVDYEQLQEKLTDLENEIEEKEEDLDAIIILLKEKQEELEGIESEIETVSAESTEPEEEDTEVEDDEEDADEDDSNEEVEETLSQQNAVGSAESYLAYTAFSKSGLIKQLEFEGFSNEDASYAVDQLDVDWKEQAVLSAENYLEYTSFSRSGLIDQLKFEGFSEEEAVHAVDEIGL